MRDITLSYERTYLVYDLAYWFKNLKKGTGISARDPKVQLSWVDYFNI